MWSVRKSYFILTAATLAALVAPSAAGAADGLEEKELEAHCVVYIVTQAEDGEYRTSPPDCFPTRQEAAHAAASPFLKPQAADLDSSVHSLSSFTLGIHYDGQNGTGSSITVVGTSCTGGYWNTPTWFDNRESSSYNGCYRLRHYDKQGMAGTHTSTYGVGSTNNISAWMDNKTESVAYFSS